MSEVHRPERGFAVISAGVIHHHDVEDRLVSTQDVFNLRQRDAHATDFHVAVHPAGEQDIAVRAIVPLIAGTEGPQRLPVGPLQRNEIMLF
ncbi:hypothetical protein D3C78_1387360 [compost metagenome]